MINTNRGDDAGSSTSCRDLDLRAMKLEGGDEEVMEAVIQFLKRGEMHRLYIDCDADAFSKVCDEIKSSPNGCNLELLSTWYSEFGDVGALNISSVLVHQQEQSVAGGSMLRILDLGYNGIGVVGGRAIARALRENEALEEINLQSNSLRESVRDIGDALHTRSGNRSGLKNLNLQSNGILDEDLAYFYENGVMGSNLKVLDVSENQLGRKSDEALGRIFGNGCGLRVLNCSSSSYGSGDFRGVVLGKGLNCGENMLVGLNLSFSGVHIDGIKGLCSGCSAETKPFGSLLNFDLSSNNIGDDELGVLVDFLCGEDDNGSVSGIRKLSLRSNLITDRGVLRNIGRLLKKIVEEVVKERRSAGNDGMPDGFEYASVDMNTFCLDLSGNKIGDEGGEFICQTLVDLRKSDLLSGMCGNDTVLERDEFLRQCAQVVVHNNEIKDVNIMEALQRYGRGVGGAEGVGTDFASGDGTAGNCDIEEEDFFDSSAMTLPSINSFRERNLEVNLSGETEEAVNSKLKDL